MNYRSDIQILRGLSVVMVILYHLQFGVAKSGFLGVDVFFVISGFLMAVLYFPKTQPKKNSLDWSIVKQFWLRRAQRILPAYFATIIIVLCAAYFILNNAEFRSLSIHAVYSSLLVPNINNWLSASYFDANNFRPLLHLWSLGVEAQFYLFVPIIFALFIRSKYWLITGTLLSFVACLLFAGRSPNSAFFLLPFRFWEFALGFLCAALYTNNGNIIKARPTIGSLAFIALMGISFIDFGPNLRHPGVVALNSCLLVCAILTFGLPKKFETSRLGQWLASAGKYSYSAYIVHYPIILLYIYQPFDGGAYSLAIGSGLLSVLALILLATIACYHFIESPFRSANSLFSRKPFILSIGCAAFCALLAISLNHLQYSGYNEKEKLVVDAVHDTHQFRCGAAYELFRPLSRSCSLTHSQFDANSPPIAALKRHLLIGNSHADSLKTVLANLAIESRQSLRIWKDNFPLGWGQTNAQTVAEEVLKHNIDNIIIHASRDTLKPIALRALISVAKDKGFTVTYIDPIPVWEASVPKLAWNAIHDGESLPERSLGDHHKVNSGELRSLDKIKDPVFQRIMISYMACRAGCKLVDESGAPLYHDSHHLNLRGAQSMSPMLKRIFEIDSD